MIALIIISLILLTSYTISVCTRWGVPESVSQTWFSIRHKWIFSVVMAVSFGLLLVPLMELLGDMWQWLGFLTVAGGWMIAFAPNLDDKMEEMVHMTGAVIMGLASQGVVLVLFPLALGLWLLWGHFWYISGYKKGVFIAEVIGGACLYLSVMMNMLLA